MLQKGREKSECVNFRRGKGENLGFDISFDLIFSVDVIHHLDSPKKHIEEVHKLLKKGGKICTANDSEWIIRNREPLSVYFPETVEADLKRYPRIDELRKYMKVSGFEEIESLTVERKKKISKIEAYREKAFSVLRLISEEAHEAGIKRMEEDLKDGPIRKISRYLLFWGEKRTE